MIYSWVLALLVVAVGVCFVVSCVSIYRSGDSPFTRESVAAHFQRMAIPVWLCIAAIIGGGVLSLMWPHDERFKPVREVANTLERLVDSYDLSTSPEALQATRASEQKRRLGMRIGEIAVCMAATGVALAWCLNKNHFAGSDKTADIRTAATVVLSCAAVAILLCILLEHVRRRSFARELAAVKAAIADTSVSRRTCGPTDSTGSGVSFRGVLQWSLRGVIFAVAVAFILLGIGNGGMADVLGKAIRICTECIGLG